MPIMPKKDNYDPGDPVWFEIDGHDFEGIVVEDDPDRLKVSVQLNSGPTVDVFRTTLALNGHPDE